MKMAGKNFREYLGNTIHFLAFELTHYPAQGEQHLYETPITVYFKQAEIESLKTVILNPSIGYFSDQKDKPVIPLEELCVEADLDNKIKDLKHEIESNSSPNIIKKATAIYNEVKILKMKDKVELELLAEIAEKTTKLLRAEIPAKEYLEFAKELKHSHSKGIITRLGSLMNGLAKSVALGVVTVATVGQAKTTTTKLKTSLKESFHEMKKGAIGDLSKDLVDQVVHNGKKNPF
jgi:hypothetical protein